MTSAKYFILLAAVFLNACGLTEFGEVERSKPMTIVLYWSTPTERENGEALSREDLGGYEVRYRHSYGNESYKSVIVPTNIDQYTFNLPDSQDYTFEVAAFDTNGIYSEFSIAQKK